MVTAWEYMILSAALFAIGAAGFVLRRNIIVMFMSAELMLNAVNLNFVAYSAEWSDTGGEVFALFVIAVAAAEAAIGLAILMLLFRRRATVGSDDWKELKG